MVAIKKAAFVFSMRRVQSLGLIVARWKSYIALVCFGHLIDEEIPVKAIWWCDVRKSRWEVSPFLSL